MKRQSLWKPLRIAAAAFFLLGCGAAFAGIGGGIAEMLHVQFGPALMRCLAAFSAGALATALGIAAFTFLFGRFYCAVLCPFGILQDAIGFLSRRKGTAVPNFRRTRYAVAGTAFGMLAFGWTALFLLLDPYSNFGRIAGSFTAGSVIPLIVIVILAVWKKRIYCTAICPVGTLLGLIAKHGVFRLRLTDRCVKCGMCVKVCPAGCIDPHNGTLDNERCVRCMNCVSACRLQAVKFALPERKTPPVDPDQRRRAGRRSRRRDGAGENRHGQTGGVCETVPDSAARSGGCGAVRRQMHGVPALHGELSGEDHRSGSRRQRSGVAGSLARRLPIRLQPVFAGLSDGGDPSADARRQTENEDCGGEIQSAKLHRLSGWGKMREMRGRLSDRRNHAPGQRHAAPGECRAVHRLRRLSGGLPGSRKGDDRS